MACANVGGANPFVCVCVLCVLVCVVMVYVCVCVCVCVDLSPRPVCIWKGGVNHCVCVLITNTCTFT